MEGISSLWFQGWNSFVVYRKQESKMKRNRKYWKTSAKAALRGNWIIAIAGMLAYMAVNFLGNVLSLELFREILCWRSQPGRFLYLLCR